MRAYFVFVPVFFCSLLHAQVAGWNRVEALSPGTKVVITAQHTIHCTLSGADETGVYCDGFVGRVLIRRQRIARIAVSRPQKAILLGTVIGAAGGGVAEGLGNSAGDSSTRTLRTVLASVAGGFAGNLIGRAVGRSAKETIYVQP